MTHGPSAAAAAVLRERVNRITEHTIPFLVRRGGRDSGRGGRSHRNLLVSDHPVCGAEVGFAEIFLMPQPPLLVRRGVLWFVQNCFIKLLRLRRKHNASHWPK